MSEIPSNKPYLIRALHQWCTDFGFTPFIAVFVDENVEVPMEFVKNSEIVLNLSLEACHQLNMDNDRISFQARFGGIPKRIMVPVSHVLAIYAKENGQGMSFPFDPAQFRDLHSADSSDKPLDKPQKTGRPALKIVK
ncbi:MAG: ClpXP protease specificity-enhancing factor [Polynucleobacter sp. 17-46-58]|nr:MAG: ClpXP protease specificity-enhancing factor [Polynucleobacter sp. 35-46-207]OYZ37202.1 MAG: ClpXP protease specificity-enhancing factor [Polynucleobacter sp. 16-46-70]OZA40869.1 MAG: ClpXP protease specificity-enhancing factor [Polynucleobacter sp. 17-46-58]OZB48583.1 MAG: ClpXP protease specificity-enhancing factor [Polynucleobacter sp. 39-45-136]HQT21205.1 ClpXP protease specificity-enhancing factor [Polynucleobacter sp.]